MGCDEVSPVIAVKCTDEISTIADVERASGGWRLRQHRAAARHTKQAVPAALFGFGCPQLMMTSTRIIALFGKVVAQGHGRGAERLAHGLAAKQFRQQHQSGDHRVAPLPRRYRDLLAGVAFDLPDEIVGAAGKVKDALISRAAAQSLPDALFQPQLRVALPLRRVPRPDRRISSFRVAATS